MKQVVGIVGVGLAATLLATCGPSGAEMLGDAMVDVGGALRDGSTAVEQDASAQTGCGTCTTGGVARMMAADSDPAQQIGGRTTTDTAVDLSFVGTVASGPFFLTDARRGGTFGVSLILVPGATCNDLTGGTGLLGLGEGENLHGSRFFVPAGTTLCMAGASGKTLSWAGFRPYD